MKYVTDALGVEIKIEPWLGTGRVPYYLVDRYEFSKAALDGVPCLFMKPKGELDTLSAIKKHIAKIHETEPIPVVLDIGGMTARRRKSLIGAHIPFVAPHCQIYLPFLGIALSERYTTEQTTRETLMPSSQLLLLHYLYCDETDIQVGETAGVFGISAMQISRAVRQLTALSLVNARKDGVRTIMSSETRRHELFERAKPYLLNPVRKKIYVEYADLPNGMPLSGYSALSELTMLGGSETETFAFYGKSGDINGTDTLVDNTSQAEVEIWRYNPILMSKKQGIVDSLSLAAALSSDDDPRVEQSIDELLSKVWG